MQYDDTNDTTTAAGNAERDVLGELIQAAGRRPKPSAEQYRQTFGAAHTAWQQKVRSTQRRQRIYAVAATIAIFAIGLTALLRLMPVAPIAPIATAAVIHGDAAVFSPETGTWQPLVNVGLEIGTGSRLRTEAAGRTAFRLADGASVRLNSSSEIVFVSAQAVELTAGTVYVDSGTDESTGDLEVLTTHGRIRDVGTQFEVAAANGDLRVRVREGFVELYRTGQMPEFEGSAGEELRIDAAGAIRRRDFSPYDPEWGWAVSLAGMPDVEGMPVLEFLNWVARETGREIRFEEPGVQIAAGTAVLHGSAQDLSPLDALEVMLATTDFNYALLTDGAIVISRRGTVR